MFIDEVENLNIFQHTLMEIKQWVRDKKVLPLQLPFF